MSIASNVKVFVSYFGNVSNVTIVGNISVVSNVIIASNAR